MYGRFSGKKPKLSHVPTGMMKVMAPLLRPVQPVISRLMTFSVWGDATPQTFNPDVDAEGISHEPHAGGRFHP
jgi:hypothetical protein